MDNTLFDLKTRVENKPEDCDKRVGYNEFVYGNDYYMLYNCALHKVTIISLTTINDKTALEIKYLQQEENYLGTKKDDYYYIDLTECMPKFYGVK